MKPLNAHLLDLEKKRIMFPGWDQYEIVLKLKHILPNMVNDLDGVMQNLLLSRGGEN